MNTDKIYEYVTALNHQYQLESALNTAFQQLDSNNQIFGVCGPVTKAYTSLVESLLTPQQVYWLEYWIYECDFGRTGLKFSVNNEMYNTLDMTFFKYWEIVNA
jgi:hypothetical protein